MRRLRKLFLWLILLVLIAGVIAVLFYDFPPPERPVVEPVANEALFSGE